MQVGARLRALRTNRGLSLRGLAAASGLSANAVSRIERGESSPTVASLERLAAALRVSIAAFFMDDSPRPALFIRRDQRMRFSQPGAVLESLGDGLPGQRLRPALLTLEPGARSDLQPLTHPGQEFVHCLNGTLECQIGEERYTLSAGDSLLLQAHAPHLFRNTGKGFCSLVIVAESGPEGAPGRHQHLLT